MNTKNKTQRQERLQEILLTSECSSQVDLVKKLKKEGFEVNQSSISRDFIELGVIKTGGYYKVSAIQQPQYLKGLIELHKAGDALIVAKCEPGWASAVSAEIDRAQFKDIIGTIAGDDTIFIATADSRSQKNLFTLILKLRNTTNDNDSENS